MHVLIPYVDAWMHTQVGLPIVFSIELQYLIKSEDGAQSISFRHVSLFMVHVLRSIYT